MSSVTGLEIWSGGTLFDLNDHDAFYLETVSGLGYDVTRLSQRGPGQTGDTDLGFVQRPRFITCQWALKGCDNSLNWGLADLREYLAGILRPRDNDPLIANFTMSNANERTADCHFEGFLDYRPSDRFGPVQRVTAVLKASDPALYEPTLNEVTFTIEGTGEGWEIPWEIPWPIGVSSIQAQETIFYAAGSRAAAVEFPTIRIFGPIQQPVIRNLTTGEKLDLRRGAGLTLAANEWVEIDLRGAPRRDSKTIRKQDGSSVSRFLTLDSDLETFHLSYNSERLDDGTRSDGNNLIEVSGLGATEATRIVLYYYDRYIAA